MEETEIGNHSRQEGAARNMKMGKALLDGDTSNKAILLVGGLHMFEHHMRACIYLPT